MSRLEPVRVRAGVRMTVCVLASMLGAGGLWGCQANQDRPEQTGTAEVSPEKLASIRERYSAVEGYFVGDVEAVDTQSHRAAVAGIDPKLVNNQSIFVFVDASEGNVINSGTMHSHSAVSGRIFVDYNPTRTAPKRSDLAVVKTTK